jgi:hypothetical protein
MACVHMAIQDLVVYSHAFLGLHVGLRNYSHPASLRDLTVTTIYKRALDNADINGCNVVIL